MNQNMQSDPAPMPEEPKKGPKIWLIVGIVLVVLFCFCAIVAAVGWQYGDQILKALGM